MAKVINFNLPKSIETYLEDNGYKRSTGAFFSESIFFYDNRDRGVFISGDNADFVSYVSEDPNTRRPEFYRYMAITGISHLTEFNWKLALHIADIVVMDSFKSAEAPPQPDLLTDLFAHFQQAGSKPLPINY